MDIGHIQGPGGIDRTSDRPDRASTDRAPGKGQGPAVDSATISAAGRETLRSMEALVAKAREGEDRTEAVEQAKARLESGVLSTPAAFDGAARNLLRGGF